jgi:UDP-N-acetylmuramoyl-L-alanyl-D-glutamate--2,6-diaminopimelate ligase
VIVDFAHTPNSLENVLKMARGLAKGRIISVFGCAGLRDRTKRPAMGEIAGRLADLVVLTAEDPRTESVESINAEIVAGCERAGKRLNVDCWSVPDRESAIGLAVGMARPGDLVLITGKGHEQSLCFGTVETPWSDPEAARRQIRAALATPLPRGEGGQGG